MTAPHINQLRDHLMQTLAALRDRDNPMEPDRARAVAQVASVLVDTAKVEVDYLKATGQDKSAFLEEPATTSLPNGTASPFPPGITGITQHRLQG
jgi:hypothetical protein